MSTLVGYSDSDEEDEQQQPARRPQDTRKRRAGGSGDQDLPALPDSFLDLYATPVRTSTVDDPSLHGGRQRSNVHVQGNWPSHVFIEWRPNKLAAEWLRSTVRKLQQESKESSADTRVRSSLEDDIGTEQPLHVSLSRSLNLQTDEREAFLQALRDEIQGADISHFQAAFSGVKWVPNHEKNRWFLVAQIQRPANDELNKLLQACNRAALRFKQPLLYEQDNAEPTRNSSDARERVRAKRLKSGAGFRSPEATAIISPVPADRSDRFHVSTAWTLTEPNPDLRHHTEAVTRSDKGLGEIRLQVASIKVKIGNAIETVPLRKQGQQAHSLLG